MATPGRLWEHLRDGNPHFRDMSHLKFFVIDEADKMVKQGDFQVALGRTEEIDTAPGVTVKNDVIALLPPCENVKRSMQTFCQLCTAAGFT